MKKLLLFIIIFFTLNAEDINKLGQKCVIDGDIKSCNKLQNNCDLGDIKSCGFLGVVYFFGNKNININYFKSFKLSLKTCNLGAGPGCDLVAKMYRDGKGVKQSYFKAFNYFKKGCDLGYYSSCVDLGIAYMNGKGIKQNYNKAIIYYKKACNNNEKIGCRQLSVSYYNKKELFKSYKYAKKGCKLGDGGSCGTLGTLYEFGLGVKQNYKKAKFYYGKGCDLQSQTACDSYARLNKKGY